MFLFPPLDGGGGILPTNLGQNCRPANSRGDDFFKLNHYNDMAEGKCGGSL
ncbi:MAG: hypothetical protein LBR79_03675 [Oscillospiraceae bacterium]|nr:hypothetical protein [Oscillospiraceae bacterium]